MAQRVKEFLIAEEASLKHLDFAVDLLLINGVLLCLRESPSL